MKAEIKKILKKVYPEVATSSSRDSIEFLAKGKRMSSHALSHPLQETMQITVNRLNLLKHSHSEKGGSNPSENLPKPHFSDDSNEQLRKHFAESAPMRQDSNTSTDK